VSAHPLLVDLSVDPEVYRPVEHLGPRLPADFGTWRPAAGEAPPDLGRFTHVILTGSEASIMSPPEWCRDVESLIRVATADVVPMLGICFGHQLMARVGGGRCRRTPTPELGWAEHETWVRGPPFHLPRTFHAFTAHLDDVLERPRNYEILVSTPRCPVAAMRHVKGPFFGFQLHFEIDVPTGQQVMAEFPELFPAYRPAALPEFAAPRDDGVGEGILEGFLKL
jgi:GMP synthase (glutamine-hydrolysing)